MLSPERRNEKAVGLGYLRALGLVAAATRGLDYIPVPGSRFGSKERKVGWDCQGQGYLAGTHCL